MIINDNSSQKYNNGKCYINYLMWKKNIIVRILGHAFVRKTGI